MGEYTISPKTSVVLNTGTTSRQLKETEKSDTDRAILKEQCEMISWDSVNTHTQSAVQKLTASAKLYP